MRCIGRCLSRIDKDELMIEYIQNLFRRCFRFVDKDTDSLWGNIDDAILAQVGKITDSKDAQIGILKDIYEPFSRKRNRFPIL